MVEQAGTDSGDYSLPVRVGKLETSVDQLHQDSARTQSALASLQASQDGIKHTQDGMSRALNDIAQKLDQQRTKRPELSAMASVAAVILTIGAMAFWPVNKRLDGVDAHVANVQSTVAEHSEVIGRYAAESEHIRDQIKELQRQQNKMLGDRFTKEDGQRLEDKIDRLHQ